MANPYFSFWYTFSFESAYKNPSLIIVDVFFLM